MGKGSDILFKLKTVIPNFWKASVILFLIFVLCVFYLFKPPFLENNKKIAYIDRNYIFKNHPSFQQAKKEWLNDRKKLQKRYKNQIKNLRDKFINSGKKLSNEKQLDLSHINSKSHHSTTSETGPYSQNPAHARKLKARVKTIRARKKRSEFVIQNKRKDLVEAGYKKIQRAVEIVAQRKNIDLVYQKPEIIYRKSTDNEMNASFINLTKDVLRYMKQNFDELNY